MADPLNACRFECSLPPIENTRPGTGDPRAPAELRPSGELVVTPIRVVTIGRCASVSFSGAHPLVDVVGSLEALDDVADDVATLEPDVILLDAEVSFLAAELRPFGLVILAPRATEVTHGSLPEQAEWIALLTALAATTPVAALG
jgi:hypothetical protein